MRSEDRRPEEEGRRLDLRGLKCPLPVLRARKALKALAPGASLTLECTDPMAAIDIPHFARSEGHVLEFSGREEKAMIFRLRRGPDPEPPLDPNRPGD